MSAKIKVSYCDGCHVLIECENKLEYRVVISESEKVLVDITTSDNLVSYDNWEINYKFRKYKVDVYLKQELVFTDILNLEGKKVKINFDSNALGDTIAWMSQVDRFQKLHQCELYVSCNWKELFEPVYQNINFKDAEKQHTYQNSIIPGIEDKSCKNFFCFYQFCNCYYASYDLGFYALQPELRDETLGKIASDMLGMTYEEVRPKIHVENSNRVIDRPYVCIAVQSTAQYKYWNNPNGWQQVVDYLNEKGYQCVCIDKEDNYGMDGFINSSPKNILNKTGSFPIQQRITDILHCEFFIGLSSGLSWLAWALNKPVVMISGFSNPNSEFKNPYRVFNPNVCNSCWNDKEVKPHSKMGWHYCPRNMDYQCSKEITSEMVIEKINQITTS